MNTKKITPEIELEINLLYKLGFPISLINQLFNVNYLTVRKYIKVAVLEENNIDLEKQNEKLVFYLKMYAWLIFDQIDCATSTGSSEIINLKPILYKQLNLDRWISFLDGIIFSGKNQYSESIPDGYRKLINVLNPENTEKSRELLEKILISMHTGEIRFPTAAEITNPKLALQAYFHKNGTGAESMRYFDSSIISYIENTLIETCSESPRSLDCFKAYYEIESTVLAMAEKYQISATRVSAIAKIIFEKLKNQMPFFVSGDSHTALLKKFQQQEEKFEKLEKEQDQWRITSEQNTQIAFRKINELIGQAGLINVKLDEKEISLIKKQIDQITQVDVTYKILLNTSISELDLSVRSFNCLWNNHIRTIGKLAQCDEFDLFKLRNFGKNSMYEVEQALRERNLHLGMVIPEEYFEK